MSAKGATVDAEETENAVTNYLLNNPRMIGVLFTIMILISQAGNVAGSNTAVAGP